MDEFSAIVETFFIGIGASLRWAFFLGKQKFSYFMVESTSYSLIIGLIVVVVPIILFVNYFR